MKSFLIFSAISSTGYVASLSRKHAMNAYLNGELANELRSRKMAGVLGMDSKKSREDVMQEVDNMRRQEHYKHDPGHCTEECKKKGNKFKICSQTCSYTSKSDDTVTMYLY